jgi:transcriptional regulator with XRE-family HTH domain
VKLPANELLRFWRASKGWSIRRLASEAGMAPSKIHRLETGASDIRSGDLSVICSAFEIDEVIFYGGEPAQIAEAA